MFLLKLRGVIPRALSPTTSAGCASHWAPTSNLLRGHWQTRSQHNRPRKSSGGLHQRTPSEQPGSHLPRYILDESQSSPAKENGNHEGEPERQYVQVVINRYRPVVFALSASVCFYALFSYLEAKKELQPPVSTLLSKWEMPRRQTPPTPTEVVTRAFSNLSPIQQVSWEIISTNAVIHASKFVIPTYWQKLWHVPVTNRNYTILTSAFVHAGPLHFFFNSYVCYQFLPLVGHGPMFQGDPYHVLSFYLSAAVISGAGQHLSSLFKRAIARGDFLASSGGASGALFAVFSSFCMQYPTAEVGILFIPFHFEAQYFLPAVMLFDAVGMVRRYKFVSLGHGVSYTHDRNQTNSYSWFTGPSNGSYFWHRLLFVQWSRQSMETYSGLLETTFAGSKILSYRSTMCE